MLWRRCIIANACNCFIIIIGFVFVITPLTANAALASKRGPRTQFSPERESTFVTLPEVNRERHVQLAGAMEEMPNEWGKPNEY